MGTSPSCLEAHAGFFRLSIKKKFDTYFLWLMGKSLFPYYKRYSKLYSMYSFWKSEKCPSEQNFWICTMLYDVPLLILSLIKQHLPIPWGWAKATKGGHSREFLKMRMGEVLLSISWEFFDLGCNSIPLGCPQYRRLWRRQLFSFQLIFGLLERPDWFMVPWHASFVQSFETGKFSGFDSKIF